MAQYIINHPYAVYNCEGKIIRPDSLTPEQREIRDYGLFDGRHMDYPKELMPVLAEIQTTSEFGISTWFEVIYYDDQERNCWCSFFGSDTFKTLGYKVLRWKYADEAIAQTRRT